MKKLLTATVVTLALTLGLTGCWGQEDNPDTATSETPVVQTLLNPTIPGIGSPIAGTNLAGLDIKVSFLGAGYPTKTTMELLSPETPITVPETQNLVGDQRVIALSFSVTNTTDEPKALLDFQLGDTLINGAVVPQGADSSGLYALLGAPAQPDKIALPNPMVNPGETVIWSTDVLVPTDVINTSNVQVKQTFVWSDGSTAQTTFSLNLDENLFLKKETPNGSEEEN